MVNEIRGAGRESARVTFGASPGPALEMAMVKVTNEPALTEDGALMLIAMSCTSGTEGVTALEGRDAALLPAALVATTVKL